MDRFAMDQHRTDPDPIAAARYARLLDALSESGALHQEWRAAFERAPRAAFIPDAVWLPDQRLPGGYRRTTRTDEGPAWWDAVTSDDVVVTQLDDGAEGGPGVATSSSSMPSLVARMLGHLELADGHHVLDVGTGTGWTSALLCERLGGSRVVTVEVDPVVAARAGRTLDATGHLPTRVTGDGGLGWPPGARYDRVHATAAVQQVPAPWIEQTQPGGIIITPWGTPYCNAGLLKLRVAKQGGRASGRFVGSVSFMWVRGQRPAPPPETELRPDRTGASTMAPGLALESIDAAFAIGLRVPDVRYAHAWDNADPRSSRRILLFDGAGSWAEARYRGWDRPGAVRQAGTRSLWDEVVAARRWWERHGRPGLRRFGLTVTADGAQTAWLDHPGQPLDG